MKRRTRPTGRSILHGLLAAATLALFAAAATAAVPTAATVAEGVETGPLAAGPDGATWSLQRTDVERFALVRYDAGGRMSTLALDRRLNSVRSLLTPLDDGGMAAVLAHTPVGALAPADVVLARFDRSGTRVRIARLPAIARGAQAFAIEQDGSVWFPRTCRDAILRWRPGVLTRFPLPRADCADRGADERAQIALGPDGALWVADQSQGRLVRRDVHGRLRQWHMPRVPEGTWVDDELRLVPDPRGSGLAYGGGAFGGQFGGRVTMAGRLVPSSETGAPAFAPDGILWRLLADDPYADGPGVLERTTPRGETSRVELPHPLQPFAFALGRDATPWALAGTYRTPPSQEAYFLGLTVAPAAAFGAGRGVPATGVALGETTHAYDPTAFVLGGDGAFWTYVATQSTLPGRMSLLRIAPPNVGGAGRAVATAQRVLVRDGRSVTLQLSCAADPGRFCRGTVRLGGATGAQPFIVAGASRAGVRLRLGSSTVRTLRRGEVVRTTAIARSAGTTTRAPLVLRPARGGA
jgi:streptogramin lyase